MLNYCKESFQQFFNNPPAVNMPIDHPDFEKDLRRKHKLFGNIEFCGDLQKQRILSEITLWSVFEGLIGTSTKEKKNSSVNDNTVDAALKLISKLGQSIDIKMENPKWREKNETHIKSIYDQFEYLMQSNEKDPEKLSVSQRMKLLIKNMFDNKKTNWSKSKQGNSEIKSKQEVEEEVMRAAM